MMVKLEELEINLKVFAMDLSLMDPEQRAFYQVKRLRILAEECKALAATEGREVEGEGGENV
jgi:hypothetical protein